MSATASCWSSLAAAWYVPHALSAAQLHALCAGLKAEGGGPLNLSICHMQVQYCAQFANGAGVSLIMAYLNGNSIPDLLSFRSAPHIPHCSLPAVAGAHNMVQPCHRAARKKCLITAGRWSSSLWVHAAGSAPTYRWDQRHPPCTSAHVWQTTLHTWLAVKQFPPGACRPLCDRVMLDAHLGTHLVEKGSYVGAVLCVGRWQVCHHRADLWFILCMTGSPLWL